MRPETETAGVVICGAGPTGLMLAIELQLAGVTPVVLETLPQISEIPKGNGMYGQIVPLLDFRGLLEPMRAEATYAGPIPQFFFGPVQLPFTALPDSPLHVVALQQRQIERILAGRLAGLGGSVRRGHELTGLAQDDDGVTVEVSGPAGGYRLRAGYLAGCDGAHSPVRKLAGIGFPGVTTGSISRIGRVRVPAGLIVPGTGELDVPGAGRLTVMRPVRTPAGTYSIAPQASVDKAAPPDAYIVSASEEQPDADLTGPMTLAELSAAMRRVLGAELPMSDPAWLTRVAGNSRQADRYRSGRVLVAGDAAHVFGAGGSISAGLMDAMNLGWKLAAQLRGGAPDGLLDSYHAERHAAGERLLMQSRAQLALRAEGPYGAALRELFGELVQLPGPQRHLGELIAGADARCAVAGAGAGDQGHPLAGRPAPDLPLGTGQRGVRRLAELMRAARPVLLDFTAGGRVAAAAAQAGREVTAVPVTAAEPPADGLLIRPDGYVAWASGPGAADPAAGLAGALGTWCSPASPAGRQ